MNQTMERLEESLEENRIASDSLGRERSKLNSKLSELKITEVTELIPYTDGIVALGAYPVSQWKGHYGLSKRGDICACTPDGSMIRSGIIIYITKTRLIISDHVDPVISSIIQTKEIK